MIEKNAAYRTLVVITTPKLADKAVKVFSAEGIPLQYRLSAAGTATSEIMDILGLGSIDKSILFGAMPRAQARQVLNRLSKKLRFGSTNSGIAFTIPLTGMNGTMLKMLQDIDDTQTGKEEKTMSERRYSMIVASVNRGYSAMAMDAAREAGASGGSLLNGRRIASEAVCAKWRLGGQEEKEILLIVASEENKTEIMKKINEKCGIGSEARGMIFCVPIDEVAGF